ncbi:Sir2 N-terminal domain containing protein (plasmid) [Candidatus Trichorickettsia mobilis]|uniref:hypothetical protein n=1 Tax=Candidatus Trichorickettsia mobilis TaxID=1346319 RepID=UPI002B25A137|nr:hypothetical protein [Candidatus Trichorickettsia mobilis]WPY01725.1 Sir2 N-terminal domain containing protein [Candidatus Trichorickettsia mobilis]
MTAKYKDELNINWPPKEIITALQNSQLLIFCGAGISQGCDLPGFRDLVSDIAKKVAKEESKGDIFCDNVLEGLIKKERFDLAIFYLEDRLTLIDHQ